MSEAETFKANPFVRLSEAENEGIYELCISDGDTGQIGTASIIRFITTYATRLKTAKNLVHASDILTSFRDVRPGLGSDGNIFHAAVQNSFHGAAIIKMVAQLVLATEQGRHFLDELLRHTDYQGRTPFVAAIARSPPVPANMLQAFIDIARSTALPAASDETYDNAGNAAIHLAMLNKDTNSLAWLYAKGYPFTLRTKPFEFSEFLNPSVLGPERETVAYLGVRVKNYAGLAFLLARRKDDNNIKALFDMRVTHEGVSLTPEELAMQLWAMEPAKIRTFFKSGKLVG
ncbi:hypothetical protein QBC34DRAFT_419132 [Podospora aff. communis PSN243]|uniref:Ankyrin repeat protein n=1 Tax=Podospora aff. communis PSN243 TaxID=3040156 RepID=A0AAV9G0E3_9PEZI|nr:hypothetical protein QBC34DRAFT_419132 [Podospora aff. communis PSN243]